MNRCVICGNLNRFCQCNTVPPEPLDAEWIDADERPILKAMVGRTITAIEPNTSGSGNFGGDDWLGSLTLHLDDGTVVTLTGWGHDYWGLNVDDDSDVTS